MILYEWSYVLIDREEYHILYRVIYYSYEASGLVLNTNPEFSKWGIFKLTSKL